MSKPCSCWKTMDDRLSEHGVKLSESLTVLSGEDFSLMAVLPLERVDGKKFKGGDPQTITMGFCPLCGLSLKSKAKEEA